jgi:CheY-like chemotaxis protein
MLVDLGLPGIDGYEVARRIRNAPQLQGVVLVALSGYGDETARQRTREAGFRHHLVKPLALSTLQQLLREVAGALPERTAPRDSPH